MEAEKIIENIKGKTVDAIITLSGGEDVAIVFTDGSFFRVCLGEDREGCASSDPRDHFFLSIVTGEKMIFR